MYYLIVVDAKSESRTESRRRENGIVFDVVNRRFGDFDQKVDPESVDQQTPRIDLHAKGVAQRVELAKRNLEKQIKIVFKFFLQSETQHGKIN